MWSYSAMPAERKYEREAVFSDEKTIGCQPADRGLYLERGAALSDLRVGHFAVRFHL